MYRRILVPTDGSALSRDRCDHRHVLTHGNIPVLVLR